MDLASHSPGQPPSHFPPFVHVPLLYYQKYSLKPGRVHSILCLSQKEKKKGKPSKNDLLKINTAESLTVLVSFPVAVIKHIDTSNVREGVSFNSKFRVQVHIASAVRMPVLTWLSLFFHSVQSPAYEIVHPTYRVGLHTLSNPVKNNQSQTSLEAHLSGDSNFGKVDS